MAHVSQYMTACRSPCKKHVTSTSALRWSELTSWWLRTVAAWCLACRKHMTMLQVVHVELAVSWQSSMEHDMVPAVVASRCTCARRLLGGNPRRPVSHARLNPHTLHWYFSFASSNSTHFRQAVCPQPSSRGSSQLHGGTCSSCNELHVHMLGAVWSSQHVTRLHNSGVKQKRKV